MNYEVLLPDFVLRAGIRWMLGHKLRLESAGGLEAVTARRAAYAESLRQSPVAILTTRANEQHYELPPEFFQAVLGKHRKYSSGFWPAGTLTLDHAEEAMLALYAERAGLQNGQSVLDLGCGWGSFSLWAAQNFPASKITGVSNSAPQRLFIEEEARRRGLANVRILTADMNHFEAPETYDRIVSVEMLEHMKNYERLFQKIAGWLKPDGKFFVHIFAHKDFAYAFEDKGRGSWMARHFFSGGQMPARDLFLFFQQDLQVRQIWAVNGRHYQKTCEAWLAKMDAQKTQIMGLFSNVYGKGQARLWWARWRIFFMACAELFGFKRGEEWFVGHYLFEKRR